MKTSCAMMVLALLGLALAWPSSVFAAGLPPANAKPLSAVLAAVQKLDAGSVVEAEFEHGRWEVKTCSATACQKLSMDPVTAAEQARRRADFERVPAAAGPMITVVRRVEAAKVGVVTGVDFEHGYWKVELAVRPASAP